MITYIVGGWVRDHLLSLEGLSIEPKDRDWVVLGETPEAMIRRGFLPVGEDFPVFLHPQTHEEYALARTERKTAPGYHGFTFHASPNVTLEEDLRRRDLTINAMAMAMDGSIIDPYGGLNDLRSRVLRHVSPAFAEDPVRILRIARFAARFPDFCIAPETLNLIQSMVASGEADALVPERVQAELQKGLSSRKPERMFDVLCQSGLWSRLYSQVPMPSEIRIQIGNISRAGHPMCTRLASLTLGMSNADVAQKFLMSLRCPSEAIEYAAVLHQVRDFLTTPTTPDKVRNFLMKADALRRPQRAADLIRLARWLRTAIDVQSGYSEETLLKGLHAWRSINAGAIAKRLNHPSEIAQAVLEARNRALLSVLNR